jgi:hypothetical protein
VAHAELLPDGLLRPARLDQPVVSQFEIGHA